MSMVVGVDDSEPSFYALQWAVQQFFLPPAGQPQQYCLAVVTAKPPAACNVGLASPATPSSPPIPSSTRPPASRSCTASFTHSRASRTTPPASSTMSASKVPSPFQNLQLLTIFTTEFLIGILFVCILSSQVSGLGPSAADVVSFVVANLKRISKRVVEKAKQLCAQVKNQARESAARRRAPWSAGAGGGGQG
ncbi:hypothetical protein EJB05_54338, partial [Eragrostis curvula]